MMLTYITTRIILACTYFFYSLSYCFILFVVLLHTTVVLTGKVYMYITFSGKVKPGNIVTIPNNDIPLYTILTWKCNAALTCTL